MAYLAIFNAQLKIQRAQSLRLKLLVLEAEAYFNLLKAQQLSVKGETLQAHLKVQTEKLKVDFLHLMDKVGALRKTRREIKRLYGDSNPNLAVFAVEAKGILDRKRQIKRRTKKKKKISKANHVSMRPRRIKR
jgi:hypothetical protein